MKNVVLLTYYWPPSGGSGVQRWAYFSHYLNKEKYNLTVITVDPEKASYKFTDDSFTDLISDVQVIKTKTLEPFSLYKVFSRKKSLKEAIPQGFAGDPQPNFVDKISRFIRGNLFIPDARRGWNYFAQKELVKLCESNLVDVIITSGPPHSTHLIGLKTKAKYRVKWIADFRDPWTEVFYNKLMYKTNLSKKYDEKLELEVLNEADRILTIGPGMVELLRGKINSKNRDKVHYVLNGFDATRFEGLSKHTDPSVFVICHVGVLSDNQPVGAFVTGLKMAISAIVNPDKKIVLRLIGKVSPGIIEVLDKLKPEVCIEVVDYLPHTEAIQQMINSDLLFNSLADAGENSNLLISGKLMEYIASGNPIVCLGSENGDAAKILRELGNGFVFDRNNIHSMSQFLIKVLTKQFIFERKNVNNYSRKSTTLELEKIIDSI
jgi:glycosyltransferase involved in cell wall biosynthesis